MGGNLEMNWNFWMVQSFKAGDGATVRLSAVQSMSLRTGSSRLRGQHFSHKTRAVPLPSALQRWQRSRWRFRDTVSL
ncbi:hypothetical protein EXN66_Car009857 [Channa argus]|uniref:Uncharacterized protein n=1 Tax=Channa argus TaxID=215402 RepID=A0A6G1PV16_CHAAH|nr:hypothetical protein EXN66_Car009857 [Channa argus]